MSPCDIIVIVTATNKGYVQNLPKPETEGALKLVLTTFIKYFRMINISLFLLPSGSSCPTLP